MDWIRASCVVGLVWLVTVDVRGTTNRLDEAADRVEAAVGSGGSPEVTEALKALRVAVDEAATEARDARFLAAAAQARLASYTGAYLSRELGKLGPSERLIRMTRTTGRSSEVARYENRHRMLEEAIDRALKEYGLMLGDLCAMEDETVRQGFRAHEERLIEQGLADQIRIQQEVEQHYQAYREAGSPDAARWKEELSGL